MTMIDYSTRWSSTLFRIILIKSRRHESRFPASTKSKWCCGSNWKQRICTGWCTIHIRLIKDLVLLESLLIYEWIEEGKHIFGAGIDIFSFSITKPLITSQIHPKRTIIIQQTCVTTTCNKMVRVILITQVCITVVLKIPILFVADYVSTATGSFFQTRRSNLNRLF